MKKPKKFQPAPEWGILNQEQYSRAIDWIFDVLLPEIVLGECDEQLRPTARVLVEKLDCVDIAEVEMSATSL
jgi:hypothetical protein